MRRLLLVPALALALAGCGADPAATLRGDVEDIIAAANSNDPGAVRSEVDDLLGTIREQVAKGEITSARAAELRELALAVQRGADALEPEPSPSPQPPSPEPEPTEEPSPEPEPTEEPSPEPEPTEAPEPSPEEEEPEPEETLAPIIPDPLEPSPASAGAPASPSPSPSPALATAAS